MLLMFFNLHDTGDRDASDRDASGVAQLAGREGNTSRGSRSISRAAAELAHQVGAAELADAGDAATAPPRAATAPRSETTYPTDRLRQAPSLSGP